MVGSSESVKTAEVIRGTEHYVFITQTIKSLRVGGVFFGIKCHVDKVETAVERTFEGCVHI